MKRIKKQLKAMKDAWVASPCKFSRVNGLIFLLYFICLGHPALLMAACVFAVRVWYYENKYETRCSQ